MPRKYYPLTPSQKIHFKPIIEFGTQQVANISICMTLQAPLDFGLLKKCIQLEYERYECLRIRFTKVDLNGEVRQYVVSHDDRDIDYENLSWLSGDDAYHRMEEWSRIPFDGDNIPMNVIKMLSLPGGYNGLYIKIDHRLMDSCGAIVMVNDIMELYCHYKFGTPYPEDMASFTDMVERDLKKSTDEKRVSKDRMYWQNVLEENPFFMPFTKEDGFQKVLEKFALSFILAERQAKLGSSKQGYIQANVIKNYMNRFLEKLAEDK